MTETSAYVMIYRKDYDDCHRVYMNFSDAAEEALDLRSHLSPDEAQGAEIFIVHGPVIRDDNGGWALPEDNLDRHFEVAQALPKE